METKSRETTAQGEERILAEIQRIKRYALGLFCAGLVVAVYGLFASDLKGQGGLGSLGSFLQGTTGALWGLAGLLLIYIAFLGQKVSLLYQQEQVEITRLQLEGQKKQLDEQNENIKRQNFESAFFAFLAMHHEIVNAMKQGEVGGRALFKEWHERMRSIFWAQLESSGDPDQAGLFAYLSIFTENQNELAHYFSHLYQVIKFIKNSPMENKKVYTSILRAQLSAYERALLFYNGKSVYGQKFGAYIKEFDLLENLNESLIYENHVDCNTTGVQAT